MSKSNKKKRTLWIVNGVLVVVLIGLLILAFTLGNKKPEEVVPEVTEAPSTEAVTEAPTETEPVPTEPSMLANLAELFAKNEDVAGWVRIDDTEIDYPFVYTPDDPNKYLYMDINGDHSYSGSIIMEQRCSAEPESNNIILHGHNMKNGSMFAGIMNYMSEDYWKEHPTIYFSNLYEEREYEIIAVLHDRIYKKTDEVFKFYEFTDPQTEQKFNEGITYFKDNSFYDTGLTAEFGDRLLMLVTCSYHVDDGRLVVVAREVVEEPAQAEAE